jgi:hypothetical protein
MKRKTDVFFIDVTSVTAGIQCSIYGMLFAVLLLLFVVCWINEQFKCPNERNLSWHLLLSLFPSNGQMWPQLTGVTRKILMGTCGFSILILTSLYQAKQAEELLVPYPPPAFTLEDIENAVSSNRAKLLSEYKDSPVLNYIINASESLSQSLKSNPPIFLTNVNSSELEIINTENAIYIYGESELLNLLADIEPELCKNYLFITLDQWTRSHVALIMGKERVDILESMNVIVAERMKYVDEYIQSFQLNNECRKHLFPVYTPDPKYDAIQLVELSGTFLFLFIFLCLSTFVLLFENIFAKFKVDVANETGDSIEMSDMSEIHIIYNNSKLSTETRKFIAAMHLKMLDAIENGVPES